MGMSASGPHLELRQIGVLLGDLIRETFDHSLLNDADKAQGLLLLDRDVLLVLPLHQLNELVQRCVQIFQCPHACILHPQCQDVQSCAAIGSCSVHYCRLVEPTG